MIRGIDVSVVQGKIDWRAVKSAGVEFAVVKCGNGNDGFDPHYATNVAGARAAGLKVAAYHFVYPLPPQVGNPSRDPENQAKLHHDHIMATSGEVLTAIDCEWPAPPDWAKWGCTSAQIDAWCLAYLSAYADLAGVSPLVYTYPDWAKHVGLSSGWAAYRLWIASYQAEPFIPAPWTDYALWQNSGGTAKLPGGGPVDTDLAHDLSLWDPPDEVA